jgi:alpha-tubulin suppressor-like RCC1 family protein
MIMIVFLLLSFWIFPVRADVTDILIDGTNSTSIDEYSPIGAEVGTLSVTGGNAPYTYELVSGTGAEDNSKFAISNDKLDLNFVPNYESPTDLGDTPNNNTYTVRVKATDTEKTFIVTDGDDYSSAYNEHGGFFNAGNIPNTDAFAALKSDGSIVSWGSYNTPSPISAPVDTGYAKIYSTRYAFAALKADGSISAWGNASYGGSGVPAGTGFTKIFSTEGAFAALKTDGSISAWGSYSTISPIPAPVDNGYTKIFSTRYAFAALKSDGSITAWGNPNLGGSGAPTGTGHTKIYSNNESFAALKSDGSIAVWGDSDNGGSGAPTGTDFIDVFSTAYAFAALKSDGSIAVWGSANYGGSGAPTETGFTKIYPADYAFAALKSDGSIKVWGNTSYGGFGAPTGTGYTRIFSTEGAFVALKSDGSITAWGSASYGGSGAPTGTGYTKIYSTRSAFSALKSDGSITAWGNASFGGSGAPTGTGYVSIYSTEAAFAALKSDGSITAWGNASLGGSGAPADTGYAIPYGTSYMVVAPTSHEKSFIISVNHIDIYAPTISTNAASNITSTSATLSMTITNNGNQNPDTSIDWGTSSGSYPNSCTIGVVGNGVHACNINSLTPNTNYYAQAVATNSGGTSYGEEITFKTASASTAAYRFANLINGVYMYTISESEKNNIVNTLASTWRFEGAKYKVYATQQTGTVPVYRFANLKNGAYLYTISESEKTNIINNLADTWRYEGLKFYVYATQQTNTAPVYRFANLKNGAYLYTISESEKTNIINTLSSTWRFEGAKYYAPTN